MLPPETQHLIYDVIPRDLTIDWAQPTETGTTPKTTDLDITVAEQGSDRDFKYSEYPVVAVSFGPTTISWAPNRTISEFTRTENEPGDDTIAYYKYVGEEMYDVLNVIVAVADGVDTDGDDRTDIPKDVIAKEVAREVYASFLLGTDHLNDPAQMTNDYEWPVVVEEVRGNGITPIPSGGEGSGAHPPGTTRYAMQFNCRYELTEERVVYATDAIEYTYEVEDGTGDTLTSEDGVVDLPSDGPDADST